MTGAPTGWIKLICKRLAFAVKVRRICKQKGFALETHRKLWWLGKNKRGKINFTIHCKEKRYSVKLIGVRNPAILYGFVDERRYEIKDYTFAIVSTMDGMEYVAKPKETYCFPADTHPCIVMVPHSVKVTLREHNERKARMEIGPGDMTPEGEFFFGASFLEFLKSQ